MTPWKRHGVPFKRWLRWHEGTFTVLFFAIVIILAAVLTARAETGTASWYSGGGTACGDRTVQPMTAAHRTLPCGAVVRVTRQDGGGSVVVTVRDHGPFIKGRIVDVDPVAARALGLIGPGVRLVTVERIR